MRWMSTLYSGETSLNFIIGMRLWPPDSNFASGPSFCSRAMASSSVRGEKYSKLRGIIGQFNLSYIGFKFAFNLSDSTGKGTIIRGSRSNVNMDQGHEKAQKVQTCYCRRGGEGWRLRSRNASRCRRPLSAFGSI